MVSKYFVAAVTAIVMGALGVSARAQVPGMDVGSAGVTGTGSVTLDRQPEIMRLQLLISADGKDAREALGKLKAKESAAQGKLKALGAVDGSAQFSDPQPQDANQRQQMEQMLQMRMGRAPRRSSTPTPAVTLLTTLKAEWRLTAKDGDGLLLESLDLESKIKSAALGGDAANKLSAAEQEEVQEEQAVATPDGQANPRDPVFLFVTRISDADRDKARAEAFKKARDDAQRLARAAGSELGPIRMLTGNTGPAMNGTDNEMDYASYQQRMLYGMLTRQEGDSSAEAIGPQPGKVGYRVSVYVSFGLKGQ